MSSTLVSALHQEERSIIEELRASRPFQRLESIHSLLALYDTQPSVALPLPGLGAVEAGRPSAVVHPLAPPVAAPVMAVAGGMPSSAPIPMPGPVAVETAVADAMRSAGPLPGMASGETGQEPASVVSSVRAALLGIGKA
ncbi:hypothetical protein [Roseomonas sp. HF4]|uniref:hypothetical protein n=1 Tax=Roseomonas sp. HF4 TaxID=2562313 RepID=UPI0010C0FBD6|nr:hypothetical protein [Roseomonas sp. HF4]